MNSRVLLDIILISYQTERSRPWDPWIVVQHADGRGFCIEMKQTRAADLLLVPTLSVIQVAFIGSSFVSQSFHFRKIDSTQMTVQCDPRETRSLMIIDSSSVQYVVYLGGS